MTPSFYAPEAYAAMAEASQRCQREIERLTRERESRRRAQSQRRALRRAHPDDFDIPAAASVLRWLARPNRLRLDFALDEVRQAVASKRVQTRDPANGFALVESVQALDDAWTIERDHLLAWSHEWCKRCLRRNRQRAAKVEEASVPPAEAKPIALDSEQPPRPVQRSRWHEERILAAIREAGLDPMKRTYRIGLKCPMKDAARSRLCAEGRGPMSKPTFNAAWGRLLKNREIAP
jgi:hypothetical protein